jgi:hypothetical protein
MLPSSRANLEFFPPSPSHLRPDVHPHQSAAANLSLRLGLVLGERVAVAWSSCAVCCVVRHHALSCCHWMCSWREESSIPAPRAVIVVSCHHMMLIISPEVGLFGASRISCVAQLYCCVLPTVVVLCPVITTYNLQKLQVPRA